MKKKTTRPPKHEMNSSHYSLAPGHSNAPFNRVNTTVQHIDELNRSCLTLMPLFFFAFFHSPQISLKFYTYPPPSTQIKTLPGRIDGEREKGKKNSFICLTRNRYINNINKFLVFSLLDYHQLFYSKVIEMFTQAVYFTLCKKKKKFNLKLYFI